MPERDYSHRSVAQKLGVKAGSAVLFADDGWVLDDPLRREVLALADRPAAADGAAADVILVATDAATDAVAMLRRWKGRVRPNGGIWLLTPKRGYPGYVDQNALIAAGVAAGLVDNNVCSVSDRVSAIRFVIRKADRPAAACCASLASCAGISRTSRSTSGRG